MASAVDLHLHTTSSDGTLSPAELVQLAVSKGLSVIAVTDHDTVSGIDEALDAAAGTGLTVIPGIEISTRQGDTDVHILGYYIDENSPAFCDELNKLIERRDSRNKKIIARMNRDGIPVTAAELAFGHPDSVITRAHFARYLASHNYCTSIKDAFQKYVGLNCPYYIPRDPITPGKAVDIINKGGGLAFMAHPGIYHLNDPDFKALLRALIRRGLDGIEAFYSSHSAEQTAYYLDIAKKYELLVSGGSDFHGENKPDIRLGEGRGNLDLPLSIYEKIKAAHDASR